jgi:hypothetical protein
MVIRWFVSLTLMSLLGALMWVADVDAELWWTTQALAALVFGYHREVLTSDGRRPWAGPWVPTRGDESILFSLWGVPLGRARKLKGGSGVVRQETGVSAALAALPWWVARPLRQVVLGPTQAQKRAREKAAKARPIRVRR